MDRDKTPISISTMSDLAKCQMRLGLHCLECDRWAEIIPQEWLDAGKSDVNHIEQKFKCSGSANKDLPSMLATVCLAKEVVALLG